MGKSKREMFIGVQGQDPDTAYIVQPIEKNLRTARRIEDIIHEAEGLARAISLQVLKTRPASITHIDAGAYFGKGTRAEIAEDIESLEPSIVIVNTALSPVQQRNLEKEWNAKVIDRTGLILEIFGARAQTKEGRLQVELAALDYQKSRLVRSWTHLERQRGGAGFMGGPGERQIELDRRIITTRITKLKKELEDVRRTRDLGRASRARVPYPIVSFVGYTNAGKSTLFNRITSAGVFAEDLPFATLDPTMRKMRLPNNQDAIFADTVGFISDLPTHLVESFRATLEQIIYADVIVHIIDVSRDDYKEQRADVIEILKDLGVEYDGDERIIEVYNKIDALPEEEADDFIRQAKNPNKNCISISALTGYGVDSLMEKIARITAQGYREKTYVIPHANGKAVSWLYEHTEILSRTDGQDNITLKTRITEALENKFNVHFGLKPKAQKRS